MWIPSGPARRIDVFGLDVQRATLNAVRDWPGEMTGCGCLKSADSEAAVAECEHEIAVRQIPAASVASHRRRMV